MRVSHTLGGTCPNQPWSYAKRTPRIAPTTSTTAPTHPAQRSPIVCSSAVCRTGAGLGAGLAVAYGNTFGARPSCVTTSGGGNGGSATTRADSGTRAGTGVSAGAGTSAGAGAGAGAGGATGA